MKEVEILKDYKPHQVLALCLHFYNKGFYIKKIEYGRYFQFDNINNINNMNEADFTLTHNIDNYEFRFTNFKKEKYNNPKTSILFKYNNTPIKFHYEYIDRNYNDLKLISTVIYREKKQTYNFHNYLDELKIKDEQQKFYKTQNKIIKHLKFYEKNKYYISDILSDSYSNRSPVFSIDYVYDFKPYIDSIIDYQKKDIVDINKIEKFINCVYDDMQDSIEYKHKILTFRRNNYNSFVTKINKSFSSTTIIGSMKKHIEEKDYNLIDSSYKIIIPIIDQLGGINALQNIILQHRILTE